ncbi:hypothetical protein EVAR_17496_1 [Eumeta japonica]|uniref:Uncharacterized protein n=1 Tax=Eumeta variegata TaxID=151549 RepID=A0A4C1ZEV0_EUMVA|nr:hypothetical protein EVAR_17496_1 [Eumeta japonica]
MALSAATRSRNSVTKIIPNTPPAYHIAQPSVRLTCMYMVRLYEARTDRDELFEIRRMRKQLFVKKRGRRRTRARIGAGDIASPALAASLFDHMLLITCQEHAGD